MTRIAIKHNTSIFEQWKRKFQALFYSYDRYARLRGVKFGHSCHIATRHWGSEPFLIEIGNHVQVTAGVQFITHDGGVWVFRGEIPAFSVYGKIKVGDNTYLGNNTVILPGVTIGKNCVIGANSLVTKSIPDDTVAAGLPCHYICSTQEYKERMLPLNAGTLGKYYGEERERVILSLGNKMIVKKMMVCE